jgi:hypothetical protein
MFDAGHDQAVMPATSSSSSRTSTSDASIVRVLMDREMRRVAAEREAIRIQSEIEQAREETALLKQRYASSPIPRAHDNFYRSPIESVPTRPPHTVSEPIDVVYTVCYFFPVCFEPRTKVWE